MNNHVARLLALTDRELNPAFSPQTDQLPDADHWRDAQDSYKSQQALLRDFRAAGQAYQDGALPVDTAATFERILPEWTDALTNAAENRSDLAMAIRREAGDAITHAEERIAIALPELARDIERLRDVTSEIEAAKQLAASMPEAVELILDLKTYADYAMTAAAIWNAHTAGKSGAVIGEASAALLGKTLPSNSFNIENAAAELNGSISQNAKRIAEKLAARGEQEILVMNGLASTEELLNPVREGIAQISKANREIDASRDIQSHAENIQGDAVGVLTQVDGELQSRADDVQPALSPNGPNAYQPSEIDLDGDGTPDATLAPGFPPAPGESVRPPGQVPPLNPVDSHIGNTSNMSTSSSADDFLTAATPGEADARILVDTASEGIMDAVDSDGDGVPDICLLSAGDEAGDGFDSNLNEQAEGSYLPNLDEIVEGLDWDGNDDLSLRHASSDEAVDGFDADGDGDGLATDEADVEFDMELADDEVVTNEGDGFEEVPI